MFTLYQFLHRVFTAPQQQSVSDVQTALHPVREEDAAEGAEFLDDFVRMDDEEDNEPK